MKRIHSKQLKCPSIKNKKLANTLEKEYNYSTEKILSQIDSLNKELEIRQEHEYLLNVFKAMITFTCIFRFEKYFIKLPKELIAIIVNKLWHSREDKEWKSSWIYQRVVNEMFNNTYVYPPSNMVDHSSVDKRCMRLYNEKYQRGHHIHSYLHHDYGCIFKDNHRISSFYGKSVWFHKKPNKHQVQIFIKSDLNNGNIDPDKWDLEEHIISGYKYQSLCYCHDSCKKVYYDTCNAKICKYIEHRVIKYCDYVLECEGFETLKEYSSFRTNYMAFLCWVCIYAPDIFEKTDYVEKSLRTLG